MRKFIGDIGRGFYNLFIGTLIVALVAGGVAIANYAMTQGSGTNFGSLVISTVHYPQMMSCDPTTPSQCGAVDGSGNQAVKDAAVLAAVQAPIPAQSNFTTNIGAVSGVVNVTPTDCSGTITTGGTQQSAITAQTTLHGFTIANIDSTTGSGEPLWISFTGSAAASTAASYPLSAPTATTFTGLSSYTTPLGFGTGHAVSVIGATTGHKFSCTWW